MTFLRTFISTQYDAVIIGAGWAGIRATKTLLDSGVQSILVLEANDYIGGRARSINDDGSSNDPNMMDSSSNNVPLDLGCEWLYDTGSEMEDALVTKGFLNAALDNDKNTAVILETGQFYQQIRNNNNGGEITTSILEDADEWMEDIWGGFLRFRKNRLDRLEGLSYAGE